MSFLISLMPDGSRLLRVPHSSKTRTSKSASGLRDSGANPDLVLAVHGAGRSYTWSPGGPLQEGRDGRDTLAYYRITLSLEKPCDPNDGGPYGGENPPPPPGKVTPPCPVGTIIEARP